MAFLKFIPSLDQLLLRQRIEIIVHFKELIPITEVLTTRIQKFLFSFGHFATNIQGLSLSRNKVLTKIEWS